MEEPTTEDRATEDVVIEDKAFKMPLWGKVLLWVLGIAAVIAHLLLSGWGGYIYAYAKCGVKQPLIAISTNSPTYDRPGDFRYSAPGEGPSFKGYYCTDAEARAAGFLHVGN
jgi:hypothetical protein